MIGVSMGKLWVKVMVASALGVGLGANDYNAEIANGGLRARQETRVAMRSEKLFISQAKIRVEYEFMNESSEAVETVVAFPWPGYAFSYSVGTYDPTMLTFSVQVNGVKVGHQTEVRAFVGTREITQDLQAIHVDAATFGGFDQVPQNGTWLSADQLDRLRKIGAIDSKHEMPEWMAFVTHHWKQAFPPGQIVRVVHEYVPMSGGASYRQLTAISHPAPEIATDPSLFVSKDFDMREPGCPDSAFSRAFAMRQKELEKDPSLQTGLGLPMCWIRYILTTANSWKGPIRDFELIVERNPDELVTFCWDGPVKKVSPNQFQAVRKDFRPEKELTVYFVPSLRRK